VPALLTSCCVAAVLCMSGAPADASCGLHGCPGTACAGRAAQTTQAPCILVCIYTRSLGKHWWDCALPQCCSAAAGPHASLSPSLNSLHCASLAPATRRIGSVAWCHRFVVADVLTFLHTVAVAIWCTFSAVDRCIDSAIVRHDCRLVPVSLQCGVPCTTALAGFGTPP
jgi:hypothetical protein